MNDDNTLEASMAMLPWHRGLDLSGHAFMTLQSIGKHGSILSPPHRIPRTGDLNHDYGFSDDILTSVPSDPLSEGSCGRQRLPTATI